MNLNPDTDLSFTRALNAPRMVLWECWTTPKHIMNFFMPRPHSLDACEIDLRIGGKFNTTMNVERIVKSGTSRRQARMRSSVRASAAGRFIALKMRSLAC